MKFIISNNKKFVKKYGVEIARINETVRRREKCEFDRDFLINLSDVKYLSVFLAGTRHRFSLLDYSIESLLSKNKKTKIYETGGWKISFTRAALNHAYYAVKVISHPVD